MSYSSGRLIGGGGGGGGGGRHITSTSSGVHDGSIVRGG